MELVIGTYLVIGLVFASEYSMNRDVIDKEVVEEMRAEGKWRGDAPGPIAQFLTSVAMAIFWLPLMIAGMIQNNK